MLKLIIDSNGAVEYSGKDYNLIALIQSFSFFENRLNTSDTDGLIVTIIPKSSGAVVSQTESLIDFLDENQINFEINEAGELIYIKE